MNTNAGAATPVKKKWGAGKIVLAGLGGLILLAVITSGGGNGGGDDAANSVASAAAVPPLAVTATELFDAYQSNEAAAQQSYGDRRLAVTGTVDGVDLDFSNEPVVKLKTSNQFMSAQASLVGASQPQAGSLQKGQKVTLICEGVGEVIGTPMLKDCTL